MVFSVLGVGAMGAFVQQAALGPMGSRFTGCWGWVRRRMFALGWSGMVLVPDAGVFPLSAGRSILPQKYFLREILCRICRLGGLWRHISSVRPLYSDQLFLSGGILWSAGTGLGHRAAPDLLLDGRAFGNRRPGADAQSTSDFFAAWSKYFGNLPVSRASGGLVSVVAAVSCGNALGGAFCVAVDRLPALAGVSVARAALCDSPNGAKGGRDMIFKEIYEEYSQSVYRFCLSLVGNPDEAEELMQETFYRAFLAADRFEGRSTVYTWLCQIGKNAWLKECRRRRRYGELPAGGSAAVDTAPSPEEWSIVQDEYARVRRAIFRLEEPYKDVFVLHMFGGLPLKEIAQAHGKSESWARVSYYRAKQKIIQEAKG